MDCYLFAVGFFIVDTSQDWIFLTFIFSTEQSVFDLLIDDGPNGNSEGSPVHEAHVAFSLEGVLSI